MPRTSRGLLLRADLFVGGGERERDFNMYIDRQNRLIRGAHEVGQGMGGCRRRKGEKEKGCETNRAWATTML